MIKSPNFLSLSLGRSLPLPLSLRRCVFEIIPIAYQPRHSAPASTSSLSSSSAHQFPAGFEKEEEEKEGEGEEEGGEGMEGTVVRFGQLVQLVSADGARSTKYLAASSKEAALLEQTCAKIFFRSQRTLSLSLSLSNTNSSAHTLFHSFFLLCVLFLASPFVRFFLSLML
jgi:hypothetical protein